MEVKGTEASGTSNPEPNTPVPNRGTDSNWVTSIKDKLDRASEKESARPWAKHSIYRVPRPLRETDEQAYVPRLVSIGPYHRGRHPDMELHKWRALHNILRRTGDHIELYLESIASIEDTARACYEGHLPLGSEEFVEMLVLDGAFLLELFLWSLHREFGEYLDNDPVFAMRCTMQCIQRDLILLENQIPLFVLDRLLSLQLRHLERPGGAAGLAFQFFNSLVPTDEPPCDAGPGPSSEWLGLHCLDVFRQGLLIPSPPPAPRTGLIIRGLSCALRLLRVCWRIGLSFFRAALNGPASGEGAGCICMANSVLWDTLPRGASLGRRQQMIRCVSELREAGIKFRRRKTDRFWDIEFKRGVLHIPRLIINDGTKSLLLNLIAFEQCHMGRSNDITSYVIFMDNLINSDRDVGYLHYRGIIEHWLGNDGEVADLFNRLCREVAFDFDDSYLSVVSKQVNRYCDHRWNAWRASLKHNYFGNPWAIISLFAAAVLLLLSSAQTFYAVYSYHWPSS